MNSASDDTTDSSKALSSRQDAPESNLQALSLRALTREIATLWAWLNGGQYKAS